MNFKTADPSLQALFPTHHGLLTIHTLPAPHTLLPASDKLSTLRGLSSAAGSGENNLAFKCSRKRLLFETLHLDVEGGVGERRTTPATNSIAQDAGVSEHQHHEHDGHGHVHGQNRKLSDKAVASATIEIDGLPSEAPAAPVKKEKKKVAFHSERPDLYDF